MYLNCHTILASIIFTNSVFAERSSLLTSFLPNNSIGMINDRICHKEDDATGDTMYNHHSLSELSTKSSSLDMHSINSVTNSFVGPPLNSYYETTMKIPIIGYQSFRLRIKSTTLAELVIEGILNINDEVPYSVNEVTGELNFCLSQVTTSILRKFRTKLIKASYCHKTDTPMIEVRPPLPTTIKIRMKRIFDNQREM